MADEPTAEDFPLLTPMLVMRFDKFKAQGHIPRSDEAETKELLENFDAAASDQITVFIFAPVVAESPPGLHGGRQCAPQIPHGDPQRTQLIAKFGHDQRQVYICK